MWRGAMNDLEESPLKAVVVGGPTASGKSEVARQIAREFGGVVINADSMQVYQELQIVTARPDAAALAAVPHFLYGVLSARERCSVVVHQQIENHITIYTVFVVAIREWHTTICIVHKFILPPRQADAQVRDWPPNPNSLHRPPSCI